MGAHILPLKGELLWAVLPLGILHQDAELLPGWGRGCHECPSLFLALQGPVCKAVDSCRCFKLLKGLGRAMSNPKMEEMWRQLAGILILLFSSQGKEWRDLFVMVLPFVGGWAVEEAPGARGLPLPKKPCCSCLGPRRRWEGNPGLRD